MDQKKFEIKELILQVCEELKEAQYSDSYIEKFYPVWERLNEYLIKGYRQHFNENIR